MSERWDNYYRHTMVATDRQSGLMAVAGIVAVMVAMLWVGGAFNG